MIINEHSSAQSSSPISYNMKYEYSTSHFDLMNISSMQNPNDLYSYYPASLYQPFGTFDEHTQWASTDTSAGIPSTAPPPGPMQYHPQMYQTSGLDMARNPFDYSSAHQYSHYHPAFPPSTYPGAPSIGASGFDMPWNSHNLSMQVGVQQQMQPIGGQTSNKKLSVYDEYPSTSVNVGDMLAQQINSVDLNDNNHRIQNYENGKNIHAQNFSILSLKEQQNYQSTASDHSITRSTSSGPKSYASVVSSDTINVPGNRSTSSASNTNMHSTNERTSNSSNDASNSHANTQQYRNTTTGYNPRHHYQQQQQQHPLSGNNTGNFLNWTNNNHSDRSANNNSKRHAGSSSHTPNSNQSSLETMKNNHQYNPKDFNLNPKGARFFVIKSYSEDDVHRSIKYNIWCSTEHGNKRLDNAFREREGKGSIYLFYSVNASGHFCGMAEMMSPVDYEHQTDVWHMSNKWQGKFEVKWIYVKDVPNQQFRNIRLENNENKPVTNSRDTQEIPYEKGKLMLKTLHMYRHKTSIFDDFQYYESKQAEEFTSQQYPTDDFNHDNKRSNRTLATAPIEQEINEHDHET